MVRPILLAGFVAILPTIGQAQGRVMMPASRPVTVAPRAVAHAAQPVVVRTVPVARIAPMPGGAQRRTSATPTARITGRAGGTQRIIDATALSSDFIPVPGLGFDMVHLAATRGPEAVGAGRQRRQVPFFFPFFDGGFFLPTSPVVIEVAAVPEASREEGAEAEVADASRRGRAIQPAPAPPQVEEAGAGQRQPEEFVFVRRDGTVFFAVAYAWENGTLRYITSEGWRRSVSRESLDLAATQQFNEQRGLNFRLPA